jgi:alcohol dehydrogenase class IV
MDALTHAVEAYIGKSRTNGTKSAAEKAVRLIFENLERAYKNGQDIEARANMLHASYLAGTAFTKSYVGYVHAVAHTLGGRYGIAHGLANAVLLPKVLRAYGSYATKSLAELARAVNLTDSAMPDNEAAEIIISHIEKMNENMGIPTSFPALIKSDIPEMARLADKEANPLYPVPVLWDAKELEMLYYLVYSEENQVN